MDNYLHSYSGMPGTKGTLRGPMVDSATEAVKAIASHPVCSATSDEGSIIVWRDADGRLNAAFSRYCSVQASETFSSKAALRRWLTTMWPAMSTGVLPHA